MPRARDNAWVGNFGRYPISGKSTTYPEDEVAIENAIDEMFSMCGNAGQETLIGRAARVFEEWAIEALESPQAEVHINSLADRLIKDAYEGRQDKWDGTQIIWEKGYGLIAHQSGYHDSQDELGEGTGDQFDDWYEQEHGGE